MGSTTNGPLNMEIKEESSDKQNDEEVEDLEWSADQEILLLYSLHGYKPVGPNKHFRMLLIQDRLSNAMNKNISSKAIWKKLNSLYDLEALDEAEAEADAMVTVETEFVLPEDEYGEIIADKLKEEQLIKVEKQDAESENSDTQGIDVQFEVKTDIDSLSLANEVDNNKEYSDIPKGIAAAREIRKEGAKRLSKKKDTTPIKESVSLKKDNTKEISKRDSLAKKEVTKEGKKGVIKEDDKKDFGKKTVQELKKDTVKEEKKETATKTNKRESSDRKFLEQNKKDEVKKTDQKKLVDTHKNQRAESIKPRAETPKQLRAEIPKRIETKTPRTEIPKPQWTETTPKLQRVEVLKKESSADKKKDTADKKAERKSPEKSSEPGRGAKLRMRDRKETEPDKPDTPTGTKRERSRDSTSKATDIQTEEPQTKRIKTPVPKGRSTRNSIEPQQKPTSAMVNPASPQKRRTRIL